MDPAVIVAIVGAVIGLGGLLFGVYKYFSTWKVAKVSYEISQISDYGVPPAFLEGMTTSLINVTIQSIGSKKAENVVLRLRTKSDITHHTINPSDIEMSTIDKRYLQATIPVFNPAQSVKLTLSCSGNPIEDHVDSFELTHAEGAAIDKKSSFFTKVRFHFLFMDFEFDVPRRTLRVLRFGPWTFSQG